MVRVLLCIFCLAFALGLTSNRRRADRDAQRALANLEMSYDLPRLGDVRDAVVDRLRVTKEWTTMGTQAGLVATAAAVWVLPQQAGADPFVLALLVWLGGQAGRALGSVRGARPGLARNWRNVVPAWLWGAWVLAAVLLAAFVAWCFVRDGALDVGAWTLGGAVLLGVFAWWLMRIALGAGSFLDATLPPSWHEALRGDAVRAAAVMAPGAVVLAMPTVVALAALFARERQPLDPTILIGLSVAGLLVFALTLLLGWLAVRWHAREVRALAAVEAGAA